MLSCLAQIRLTPLTTKKLEHQGIKVQLMGQIELANERGTSHEFVSFGARVRPWQCPKGSDWLAR
jgi:vacuolar protein sorting-associated protein 26